MRSGSRCPAFYGEIPPMRWGILNDDGGYFYCITYNDNHIPGGQEKQAHAQQGPEKRKSKTILSSHIVSVSPLHTLFLSPINLAGHSHW
mgnify:CR=1 FL=1